MKLLLLLMLCLGLRAQTTTLPGTWVGVGVGYSSTASPKTNPWASYAHLIGAGTYSYSSYDIIKTSRGITTSTRSGAAFMLRQYTFLNLHVYLLGLGTAGMATTNNTVTGSFAGGGMGVIQFGKSKNTFEAGMRVQKSGVTVRVFEMGFGRTF